MHPHQKRSIAYVLALLSIVLSLFLWAGIVRSLVASVAQVPAENPMPVASSGSMASSSGTAVPVAVPVRTVQMLPQIHFAGSKASQADDREKRDELSQWEIREMAALSIPSLGIRSTVFLPSRRYWDARDWDTLERQMQVGLLYGVVSYPHAVLPGADGSIVIAGHSSPPSDRAQESRFGSIFAALPSIADHAEILLRTGSATVTYVVEDTMIVPAGNTEILTGSEVAGSVLKLITCYPVGSTKERFVVIAKKLGQ